MNPEEPQSEMETQAGRAVEALLRDAARLAEKYGSVDEETALQLIVHSLDEGCAASWPRPRGA